MVIKRNFVIVASMVILATLGSCGRLGEDCAANIYNFEIGVKAYPDMEKVGIGDTIWLEVAAPTILEDKQTGNSVDYSGSNNLGSVIAFAQRDLNEHFSIKAAKKFNLILVNGQYVSSSDQESYNEYRFIETDGLYRFKLGVIPKEKGIFRIGFSNAANVFRSRKPCTKAMFVINFIETDIHYNLFPDFDGDSQKTGGYCFRVD